MQNTNSKKTKLAEALRQNLMRRKQSEREDNSFEGGVKAKKPKKESN